MEDERNFETLTGEEEAISQPLPTAEPEPKITSVKSPAVSVNSWSYYALGLIALLIVVDRFIVFIGGEYYWTIRTVYFSSFIARAIVLLVVVYFTHKNFFRDARTCYSVLGGVGFVSGIILACVRYITAASIWSFINLVIEPIDSVLIGLLIAFIALNITKKP